MIISLFLEISVIQKYCFDTRIKAIDKIIEIEKILKHVRSIWCLIYYHKIPKKIKVFWDKYGNLINHNTRKPITNKDVFNTELEAVQYAINHPDPIFLIRKKELENLDKLAS